MKRQQKKTVPTAVRYKCLYRLVAIRLARGGEDLNDDVVATKFFEEENEGKLKAMVEEAERVERECVEASNGNKSTYLSKVAQFTKSSEFERVVPVPRGLRAEHVTLCAVENGVLELRLRDPLAIEKRIVPVFSTSPPPLPSPPSQEVAAQVQPMMTPTTIAGSEEEKKPTEQQDNRVVLMKTEVPGYSAKDIECCINVDRTIEAKRSNGRGVKIGIPNSINVDSIKAYCEHGIFQVLGETEPPFTPRAVAVDIAGPSEDAEKQKMLKQLEDTMVEEDQEEEENDAVLVNKKEGVDEEKKTSA